MATAIVTASLAAACTVEQLGAMVPSVLLMLPILLIAYVGGLRCGLYATLLVAVGAPLVLKAGVVNELTRGISLAVVGGMVCLVIGMLHRTRTRAVVSRRDAEHAAARFAELFQRSPVAMSLSRLADRRVVEINEAYTQLFGVSIEELEGRSPDEVGIQARPGDRDAMFAKLTAEGSLHFETSIASPAGTRHIILWSRVVKLDGEAYAMTTFLDVTARKQAEDAVCASDQRLRELSENIQEVFWMTDPKVSRTLYVSPSYERIFDRTCADLYADARDWLNALHADDRARLLAHADSGLQQPSTETYRIVRRDGTLRRIQIKMFPICDEHGVVVRVAGVGEDVTDRLVLEEQVRQTQKLESLGLLAGGVAHDFNNILAVIVANTNLLTEAMPADHPDRELVDDIDSAVNRATQLTRQLLAFSRKQVVEPVVLDLNAAVTDTRKMLRRMVGEDIVITSSLEPELPHVRIDPNHLVQITMNLAVNARDAMPCGGTLTITTRSAGGEVMLSITDSGCGMATDVQQRAFEPFFTTKGLGKGTGLGLSVVHGIVQQAGGRIELESVVGVGTSFRIFLPRVDEPIDQIDNVAAAGASGTEKILVVDDDLFVRMSTSRALRARGYTVLEAGDGQAALRLLRDHGHDVALLVTDVVMPGMDGRELVNNARSRRPSLKVLYISGYNDDAVLRHGVAQAEVNILEKPFRPHVLTSKVRQIIDQAER